MGILDNLTTSNNTARRPAANDRPSAKVWINVGYEANGKFINLPVGIPVDTMEALPVRGQNEDWVKVQSARNALLDAVQKAGAELAPGAEVTLNLQLRLRKSNDEQVIQPENNEYALTASALIG